MWNIISSAADGRGCCARGPTDGVKSPLMAQSATSITISIIQRLVVNRFALFMFTRFKGDNWLFLLLIKCIVGIRFWTPVCHREISTFLARPQEIFALLIWYRTLRLSLSFHHLEAYPRGLRHTDIRLLIIAIAVKFGWFFNFLINIPSSTTKNTSH